MESEERTVNMELSLDEFSTFEGFRRHFNRLHGI